MFASLRERALSAGRRSGLARMHQSDPEADGQGSEGEGEGGEGDGDGDGDGDSGRIRPADAVDRASARSAKERASRGIPATSDGGIDGWLDGWMDGWMSWWIGWMSRLGCLSCAVVDDI